MVTGKVKVVNRSGFHVRPAGFFSTEMGLKKALELVKSGLGET